MSEVYTPEPKWGTIEQKDDKGNVVSVKEGLVLGRGENKRVISPDDVMVWARTHASYEEMATFFEVKTGTFRDHFRGFVEKAQAETKMKLRQKQIDVAMSGNATMLIWLGKNMLGQAESPSNTADLQPLPLGNDINPEAIEE